MMPHSLFPCGSSLNSHFSSEGEFHHPRDSSPVKNGFSHIDPMLEVSIITPKYHNFCQSFHQNLIYVLNQAELDDDTSDTLGDSLELES